MVKLHRLNYRSFPRILLATCAMLCVGILSAATLEPGVAFPKLEKMQDQHEQAYEMPAGVQHVAVAFSMSVGKSANGYFAEKGATFLPEQHSVFIANINGMPGIGRFFAMPKMKKYPHRIMLADADGLLDDFPQKDGQVTVFDLDSTGKIQAIRYWDPKSSENPF